MSLTFAILWTAFLVALVLAFTWFINELDVRKRRREKMHPGE